MGSVLLVKLVPQFSVFGSYFLTGLAITILEFLYVVVVYPKFFSPLRHLPMPGEAGLFMGHFRRLRKDPSGYPHREWMETIPNEGLIRYFMMVSNDTTPLNVRKPNERLQFNSERVFITSPKLLGEVLTTNSYTFIKPPQLRYGLGQLLGIGILLAEGDEHKVRAMSEVLNDGTRSDFHSCHRRMNIQ